MNQPLEKQGDRHYDVLIEKKWGWLQGAGTALARLCGAGGYTRRSVATSAYATAQPTG